MVSFENCKDIAIKSFFQKVRTQSRKKFLIKAKAWLYFLMFILTRSIPLMFTKNLAKSFNIWMETLFMNECMYA